MSTLIKNAALLSIIVAFTVTLGPIADAATKIEQTCVKTNIVTANKTTAQIGEGHELIQELSMADIEFSNTDFKAGRTTEWAYIHMDLINGSGKATGYFTDFYEDGGKTYGAFQGTVTTAVEPNGSWQANWEGQYRYLGGTGKFKNIKGNGTYKGMASSTEPAEEECQEVVEY
jgi:hypothetical protein